MATLQARFQWTDDKLINFIKCSQESKSSMEFRNCDSNDEKAKLYENVRKSLAEIYMKMNQIKRGYSCVYKGVKNLRHKFSEPVKTGRGNGSGQITIDYYDELVKLRGGSSASEPLSSGSSTTCVNDNVNADTFSDDPTAAVVVIAYQIAFHLFIRDYYISPRYLQFFSTRYLELKFQLGMKVSI